ncbi:MAG TPA: hypothetical protein DCO75_12840 [Fibrobacteres bacterium]|jgi:hypothetical protein|nr:hypothetical protein [Fibrobacterota bacterium]
MSSVFHVLEEEFERLNEAKNAYEAAIKREKQGAPQIKRVGNKDYLYLARRLGEKIKFHYVGRVEDKNTRAIFESVKNRREYEGLLKGVKNDIKEVKKALRGRKI